MTPFNPRLLTLGAAALQRKTCTECGVRFTPDEPHFVVCSGCWDDRMDVFEEASWEDIH